MASASKNPFRRSGLGSPPPPAISTTNLALRPALVSSSVFGPDADTTDSEASDLSASTPRSKTSKKVRVQSPPPSPHISQSALISRKRSPSPSRSLSPPLATQDPAPVLAPALDLESPVDPVDAQIPDQENDDDDQDSTPESTPRTAGPPHNPFSKTLQDMKDLTSEARTPTSPKSARSHSAKTSLDVQAFQRLLLTGSTGLDQATSPRPAAESPVFESASRSPSHNSRSPPQISSHVPNAESPSPPSSQPSAPTHPHKKPPPPPSSRHGRSIKSVDLTHMTPPLTSPQRPSPTLPPALNSPPNPAVSLAPGRPDPGSRAPAPPPPPRRMQHKATIVPSRTEEASASASTTTAQLEIPTEPYASGAASPTYDEIDLSTRSPVLSASLRSTSTTTPLSPASTLHIAKVKPQPPPTRNPSVRRPKNLVRTASATKPELSRKPSNASNRSHAPPPPPTPRQRGWSKGSADEGAVGAKKSADLQPIITSDAENDILAEINALQKEVEAAMKGGKI
ncbi:hypothetical protein Cpir12675_002888 [Ceratocystis pirilliformis]|uniref:Uncharacterized protein n=1 Tax=Ceratocystis pirilliformis TaxID=259994 RepID=A0ABR3Z6J0_9PEZI